MLHKYLVIGKFHGVQGLTGLIINSSDFFNGKTKVVKQPEGYSHSQRKANESSSLRRHTLQNFLR